MPSRDLEKAREAYQDGDVELSIQAHTTKGAGSGEQATELHAEGAGGEIVKSLVFGGLDGVITTFAVVCTVAGADLSAELVILMGFANLLADGLSMGLGDYLSERSEEQYVELEYNREKWETENYLEGEVAEMVELYEKRGVPREDAEAILGIMSKHKDLFLDHMMVEELGLMPPGGDDDDGVTAAHKGFVTFAAFIIFGCVPLLAYVAFLDYDWDSDLNITFVLACVATACTLFALGVSKARFTKANPWREGMLMMMNGGCAASAAYFAGWALEEALDIEA